jgi:hypothetical protein
MCAIKEKTPQIFESLKNLFQLLVKHKKQECDVLTFLENYSENIYDVNHIDNRLRTPIHTCAVRKDVGVLVGFL